MTLHDRLGIFPSAVILTSLSSLTVTVQRGSRVHLSVVSSDRLPLVSEPLSVKVSLHPLGGDSVTVGPAALRGH